MTPGTKPIEFYRDACGMHPIFAINSGDVLDATPSATANKIIKRDAAGRAQVVAPSVAADIARKDNVDAVQTNLNTHADTQTAGIHGSAVAATANKLVHRDASGRAQIASPSADADIANKGWVRDFIYPVGCYYVQFPDAASNDDATEFPTSQRPATLFGGTWVEQWPTESIFFRTKGVLSDQNRSSGKQEDAAQEHYHGIWECAGSGTNLAGYTGTVSKNPTTKDPTLTPRPWAIAADMIAGAVGGTPRTATETRVVNRRIKVWKRTA